MAESPAGAGSEEGRSLQERQQERIRELERTVWILFLLYIGEARDSTDEVGAGTGPKRPATAEDVHQMIRSYSRSREIRRWDNG